MTSRRNFLKTLGGMALLTVVPRHVLGGPNFIAPSDQLTRGIIGMGGIGKSSYHFTSTKECRLVAVCDVDRRHLEAASSWASRSSVRPCRPTPTSAT